MEEAMEIKEKSNHPFIHKPTPFIHKLIDSTNSIKSIYSFHWFVGFRSLFPIIINFLFIIINFNRIHWNNSN